MQLNKLQILIEIIILLSSLYLIFFKNYFKKKGENLATKEDIENITRKIETVKSEISLKNKKSEIILTEKVRAFIEIQKSINECKIYCEARYGDYLGSEFHPNTNSIPKELNKGLLTFATDLNNLITNNYIFLTKNSKKQLNSVISTLSTYCNMEMALTDKNFESEFSDSIMENYKLIEKELNILLETLYQELKNES